MTNRRGNHQPPRPRPFITRHSSFTVSTTSAFFGGVLISYLVAALILGAAAVNAWLWQSSAGHRGRSPPATRGSRQLATLEGAPLIVGRVTVVSGCRPGPPWLASPLRRILPCGLPGPQVRLGKRAPGNRLQVRLASHPPGTGDLRGRRGKRRLSFGRQADGTLGPGGFRGSTYRVQGQAGD